MDAIHVFLLLFLLLLIVSSLYTYETFDGIGKSFSTYYPPEKCCKSDDCYPGMYVRY